MTSTCLVLPSTLCDNSCRKTFLNRIITGDETWYFLHDPQLKRQSTTWKTPLSPRQQKSRRYRSKGKIKLERVFVSKGIVKEFIPEDATVNKTRYKEILSRSRYSIRRKRPDLWRTKKWLLLHDNAPAHRPCSCPRGTCNATVLPLPPYLPNFAPCVFF